VRELQTVIESLISTSRNEAIGVEQLPVAIRTPDATRVQVRERRRQLADALYENLVNGMFSFWEDVHTVFMNRDITRDDMRELVRRGLAATSGNYRLLLKLFGMHESDYKRFLNFLATHDCSVDYRVFRRGGTVDAPNPSSLLSPRRQQRRAAGSRLPAGT
jgi:hypothetical protein